VGGRAIFPDLLPAHLTHIVLAHGGDGPEHQLLTADALEGLLHFTQEHLQLGAGHVTDPLREGL
jgi:hypothetical protein